MLNFQKQLYLILKPPFPVIQFLELGCNHIFFCCFFKFSYFQWFSSAMWDFNTELLGCKIMKPGSVLLMAAARVSDAVIQNISSVLSPEQSNGAGALSGRVNLTPGSSSASKSSIKSKWKPASAESRNCTHLGKMFHFVAYLSLKKYTH